MNLQELKTHVGIAPFRQRVKLNENGYCACPFHNGDSDKSFHVVQTKDSAFVGTCFSECQKSFDAIDFVAKFDKTNTGEAIKTLRNGDYSEIAAPVHKKAPATPMTAQQWAKSGREVTEADVAILRVSRPGSVTPSANAFNELGFKIAEKAGQRFLVAPYRLGDTFYTLKARNLATKEFFQENAVSQRGIFNIDSLKAGEDFHIVESEIDAGFLHEQGIIAGSVINASQKRIEPEVLKRLLTAKRIFLIGDQDGAGQTCMDAISKLLPRKNTFRITFSNAKDVGELAYIDERDFCEFKQTFELLVQEVLESHISAESKASVVKGRTNGRANDKSTTTRRQIETARISYGL